MTVNSLEALDRMHWVHPVANWAGHEKRGVTILKSARGAFITDADGHELIDGFAGLWCVNVGYGHDSIVEAAAAQMRELPYATGYFGFGSEPAIRLAAKLAEITPGDLNHIYFSLGGSDAVDSALRLIRYYYNVTGRPAKKQIISLERGYHGSSSTGAGVTALPAFHANFDLPAEGQHYIASPYPYRNPAGSDDGAVIAASVAALRAKVEELGADTVAAFFCEPVQGSGGVVVPPKGWLKAMRDAAAELDILFVADEVITGFGRTGPMFACEAEGVVPDMMSMAKGLTSGYAPLGALAIGEKVYRAIADNAPAGGPIGHGYTYSGHPVSAAVGLEVLRLYDEGGILANGQRVGAYFEERLATLADHPLVGEVRARGLLAGVEIVADKVTKEKFSRAAKLSDHLFARGYANGVIFRAFADDIIGLAPPLCCSEAEIDLIVARLRQTLDDMLALPEVQAELKPVELA
ncbi:aminotransferase class III-fold pyridoxal phosphate-dependent enzyme [Bosea sp. BIWAKO-01]|uniref:aminotransferase class III-fold pyridoxal phosphate-dependent enzyme n=1 Tax=Bosea sp. BIWAKO-01 TaxID=506668 RepID=UPI00085339DE|nr:aminotransferase class III-fold pyridoxal phosphate-dependent enzyme [Bosea sp. BIWAKO-01]GAU84457.1 adenosylmethionine-8-amino-7-oxononanoate aminotransferase [Bosea sp. BIWAKO-01]